MSPFSFPRSHCLSLLPRCNCAHLTSATTTQSAHGANSPSFSLNLGGCRGVERHLRLASAIQQWIRHIADKNQALERTSKARVCVCAINRNGGGARGFTSIRMTQPRMKFSMLFLCVHYFSRLFFVLFYLSCCCYISLSFSPSLTSLRLSADMLSSLFIFRGVHES